MTFHFTKGAALRRKFADLIDTPARIDRATGLLKSGSVITEGLAKGHSQLIIRSVLVPRQLCTCHHVFHAKATLYLSP